jgi:hypothetical protein
MIHAADDVGISKLIVFVNRRRVASQPVAGHPTWNVRVNIPVRKVRRALTSGASVKVRIDAKVVDVAGKKADAKRTFRICD